MPLKDAYKKVTGEGVYTDDMKFPGMLFARVLHSTETHAKIKRIDTSRAEALPGVRAVCVGNRRTHQVWRAAREQRRNGHGR